jgi:hypothetical protein
MVIIYLYISVVMCKDVRYRYISDLLNSFPAVSHLLDIHSTTNRREPIPAFEASKQFEYPLALGKLHRGGDL